MGLGRRAESVQRSKFDVVVLDHGTNNVAGTRLRFHIVRLPAVVQVRHLERAFTGDRRLLVAFTTGTLVPGPRPSFTNEVHHHLEDMGQYVAASPSRAGRQRFPALVLFRPCRTAAGYLRRVPVPVGPVHPVAVYHLRPCAGHKQDRNQGARTQRRLKTGRAVLVG